MISNTESHKKDNLDNPEKEEPSKYQALHERGVLLSDEKIDFITTSVEEGFLDICAYFGINDMRLKFVASEKETNIGIVQEQTTREILTINLPIPLLNTVATQTQGKPLDKVLQRDPRYGGRELPLKTLLEAAGSEELIHFLQREQLHGLTQHPPDGDIYRNTTVTHRILCSFEVEARNKVDSIRREIGKPLVWHTVENYLKEHYPNEYNRPLEEIYTKELK